ncbi:MAG: hypothetical protein V1827_02870 [Candidatus Micrarchaeota archaeon]
MNLKTVVIATIGILLLSLVGIVVFLLASETGESESAPPLSSFSVLESGAAGDYVYSVYRFRGAGNLTIFSYPEKPKRSVVIINDSQAIQASRLAELSEDLGSLEGYGFNVSVSEEPRIGDAIYVVPTGAIPSYALFNLQQNSSSGTIIYIGEKDLLLSSGIKKLDWYDQLQPAQRSRIVLYPGTLDDFMENGSVSLEERILRADWMMNGTGSYVLSGEGVGTVSAPLNQSGYMRIVYEMEGLTGVFDSPYVKATSQVLTPSPQSRYQWEGSTLRFDLTKTNGTAFFTVKKDGKVVKHVQEKRVTDGNVFFEELDFSEPGDYILIVDDNTGQIATGLLHVKNLQISLKERSGSTFVFSVTEDGKPVRDSEAYVSLSGSEPRKYYISDGEVVVSARPARGPNVFEFTMGEAKIRVDYDHADDPLFSFYLTYGLPALVLVALVYFGARMTRRPTYRLRFGDSADYVRQEMAMPLERALESFRMIRNEMKLGSSPITPHEFSVSLKRYLTNGADVTDGNVEEILKKLVRLGKLEAHRDYYQLKGEGDVTRNVLRRMVREKLIEGGVQFRESGSRFVTADFEIGFFGDRFEKKGIVIVDDNSEEKRILSAMSESERARVRILQTNDMLIFVPIDRLSDVL